MADGVQFVLLRSRQLFEPPLHLVVAGGLVVVLTKLGLDSDGRRVGLTAIQLFEFGTTLDAVQRVTDAAE